MGNHKKAVFEVVEMSIWFWICGVPIALLLLLGIIGMWRDGRYIKRLNRAIEQGDTEVIIAALKKWDDEIVMRAATELVRLDERAYIPALLDVYFGPIRKKLRGRLAAELLKLPVDRVLPLVMERLESDQSRDLAKELIEKLNDPVARLEMEDVARAENLSREQRGIIKTLLKEPETARTDVVIIVPLELVEEFAKGRVAGKLIGGMLTGGIMAVTEDRINVHGFVQLPDNCVLCGHLPGEHDRWANCFYQFGSHGWKLMGINTSGKAVLEYKVCSKCSELDAQAAAVHISLECDEQKNWHARLSLLNLRVAEQVEELNSNLTAPVAKQG